MKRLILVLISVALFYFPIFQKPMEGKITSWVFWIVSQLQEKIPLHSMQSNRNKKFVPQEPRADVPAVEILVVNNETEVLREKNPEEKGESESSIFIEPSFSENQIETLPDNRTNTMQGAYINIAGAIIPLDPVSSEDADNKMQSSDQ